MNIRNCSDRKVLCVRNEDNDFFACDSNSPMLEVGKEYTVVDVDIHSWHTEVELEEFPNVKFNSVCFKEVEVGASNAKVY